MGEVSKVLMRRNIMVGYEGRGRVNKYLFKVVSSKVSVINNLFKNNSLRLYYQCPYSESVPKGLVPGHYPGGREKGWDDIVSVDEMVLDTQRQPLLM